MVYYEFEPNYASENVDFQDFDQSGRSLGKRSHWEQIAEATMPLKPSKFALANRAQFQTSVELRSRQLSSKIIVVNLISMLVNLALALLAFYFAFANNSSATSAFAADCILDFISSAIVLWRYCGDLNSLYMHAREQIACIYLGALFGISSLAIIIKASSDMIHGVDLTEIAGVESYELFYLAIAATIACTVLTVFKCSLFGVLRDKSILLDVINTLISTVFAMSIVMSQALINFNPSFWYLDPVLSILLALFMLAFGIKVIHQNFNVLRPVHGANLSANFSDRSFVRDHQPLVDQQQRSIEHKLTQNLLGSHSGLPGGSQRKSGNSANNWQRANYSSIVFE